MDKGIKKHTIPKQIIIPWGIKAEIDSILELAGWGKDQAIILKYDLGLTIIEKEVMVG